MGGPNQVHDLSFIRELQEEGLLPQDTDAKWFLGNRSLIGEDNIQLQLNRHHYACSLNQKQMDGWSWLIGSSGSAMKPLLCIARKSKDCEGITWFDNTVQLHILLVLGCLFGLANLVTLAVWSRCKAPLHQLEARIQLLLLRVFSALDIVGCCTWFTFHHLYAINRIPVPSIFQAIILALSTNYLFGIHFLCFVLTFAFNFVTSIYLVEYSHVAQRVLLFVSFRRMQICLAVALILCVAMSAPYVWMFGYVYCVKDGVGRLLRDQYVRFFYGYIHPGIFILAVVLLFILTAILLIVHASKRCCSCCRESPPTEGSESVRYVSQRDDEAKCDEETAADNPQIVVEFAPASPSGSQLADELRRLIFWQQVSLYLIVIFLIACTILAAVIHYMSYTAKVVMLDLFYLLPFLRVAILSPILSPVYRQGFVSLVLELRDSVLGLMRNRR